MAKLTLSIEDDLLRRAHMHAQEQGTTVNALLRGYLERFAGGNDAYRQATDTVLAIARSHRGGK
ncbi:DUF6364 family protein [Endothiovibrio diazotrophicus]